MRRSLIATILGAFAVRGQGGRVAIVRTYARLVIPLDGGTRITRRFGHAGTARDSLALSDGVGSSLRRRGDRPHGPCRGSASKPSPGWPSHISHRGTRHSAAR